MSGPGKEGKVKGKPVYLVSVVEYLAAQVPELAENTTCNNKKNIIISHQLQLAIHNDQALNKLLSDVTSVQSGIKAVLLFKKTWKKE